MGGVAGKGGKGTGGMGAGVGRGWGGGGKDSITAKRPSVCSHHSEPNIMGGCGGRGCQHSSFQHRNKTERPKQGKEKKPANRRNKSSAVMQDMDTDNGSSAVGWKMKKERKKERRGQQIRQQSIFMSSCICSH